MARPGVMLYFDMLEPLRVLSDEEKGQLLQAILEYGQSGTVPEFEGMLELAWGFVRPKIDRDKEEYERSVLRRKYATFCRERRRKKEPEMTFDQWLEYQGKQSSPDINGDQWYPTTATAKATTETTTETTTKATTETTSTAAAATATAACTADQAAAAAERKLKRLYGDLGQGVVNLSEYHIQRLLDLMGIEMFDHYVKKLSDFILREGASVKNHYQTILKWWTEDSAP